jgi:hypothetical protein
MTMINTQLVTGTNLGHLAIASMLSSYPSMKFTTPIVTAQNQFLHSFLCRPFI